MAIVERQFAGDGFYSEPSVELGGFPAQWRPGTMRGTFVAICAGEYYVAQLEPSEKIRGAFDWYARRLGG